MTTRVADSYWSEGSSKVTTEIALALLAASVPITTLIIKLSSMVSPVQFTKLEVQFTMFREEVQKELSSIRKALEKDE